MEMVGPMAWAMITQQIIRWLSSINLITTKEHSNRREFPPSTPFHIGLEPALIVTSRCMVAPLALLFQLHDSNATGQWKITLPKVSDPSLLDKTGDGVMVFILDTLPTRDQILQAAETVGSNNMLLQHMAEQIKLENIKICYQDVPDRAQTAVTGKDIYGRLAGFPMADHGLFIAGIVRDLAPEATIECIRVLNDDGVGDLKTLIKALKDIHKRMLPVNPDTEKEGDLYNKRVVINLSRRSELP